MKRSAFVSIAECTAGLVVGIATAVQFSIIRKRTRDLHQYLSQEDISDEELFEELSEE